MANARRTGSSAVPPSRSRLGVRMLALAGARACRCVWWSADGQAQHSVNARNGSGPRRRSLSLTDRKQYVAVIQGWCSELLFLAGSPLSDGHPSGVSQSDDGRRATAAIGINDLNGNTVHAGHSETQFGARRFSPKKIRPQRGPADG